MCIIFIKGDELTVGNKLKELRQKKRLSQKEFAEAFNNFIKENNYNALRNNQGTVKKISYATVSRWENGKTPIPSIYYKSLADFFDVSIQYLQALTYDKNFVMKFLNYHYLINISEILKNKHQPNTLDLILKENIDKYLISRWKSTPIKKFTENDLLGFNGTVQEYWFENFNFVFNDVTVNSLMIYGGEKEKLEKALVDAIHAQYLLQTETVISKDFDNTAGSKLQQFNLEKDDLMRYGEKQEIKDEIIKLINELETFNQIIDTLPNNPYKPNENDELPF